MRRFEFVTAYQDAGLPKPARKTRLSAGYDLCAAEDVVIQPDATALIPTGVRAFMEPDDCLLIQLRSSVGLKRGLVQPNAPAVIDADFVEARTNDQFNEGHIHIAVWNRTDEPVTIKKGERIAQAVFVKYQATDDDTAGGQRHGGFGSTGI